jgi:hypothetical protein
MSSRLASGDLNIWGVRSGLARTQDSEGSRSCLQVQRLALMRRGVDGRQQACLGISRAAPRGTKACSIRPTRREQRRSCS